MLSEVGDQLSLARALLFTAKALTEADNPISAKAHLNQASAAAKRAGAHSLTTQIDTARHRLTLGAPDNLTDRERTITTLILAGHTNREIATRLFLSTRTVEASLSKIYAKLGVKTRTRLIAHLTRDDD
jgi:DNA-binding NarL/FixJ family response regulator